MNTGVSVSALDDWRPAQADGASDDISPSDPWLPSIGLYLYLITSILRPQDWWPPLLGQPVDYFCFALILLGVLNPLGLSRLHEALTSQLSKLILAYVLVAVLSIVASGGFAILWDRAVAHLDLYIVFLGFAAFTRRPRQIAFLLFLVVLQAALLAYQGQTLVETGTGWAGQGLYWGGRIRWVGQYDGANVLCMLFAVALAFAFTLVVGPWSFLLKLPIILLTSIIVHGVYLTNSRGGFLAVLVATVLTVLLRRTDRPLAFGMGRMFMAGLTAVLVLGVAPSRIEQLNDDQHSTAGRIDAWQEGFEMLRSNPLLGIGDGRWKEHHFRLAHNSTVQTMGEMGLAGLIAWLAVLYACGKGLLSIRIPTRPDRERSLATGVLVALGAFVASSFFITTVQFDLTYILAGLSVSLARGNRDARLNQRDVVRILLFAVMSVLVVYVTARVFYATT